MRPITKFVTGAAVVLALASSVAFAATGLGGTLFGGSDAGAQGTTAGFTGSGAGSGGIGSALPVGSSVAVDTHGSLSAGSPATAGAIGAAATASGGVGASTNLSALGTHASASTTGSGSAQTLSVGSLTGTVDGMVKQAEATVNSTSQVPFSTSGNAPILGVDASSNEEAVASVP